MVRYTMKKTIINIVDTDYTKYVIDNNKWYIISQ